MGADGGGAYTTAGIPGGGMYTTDEVRALHGLQPLPAGHGYPLTRAGWRSRLRRWLRRHRLAHA